MDTVIKQISEIESAAAAVMDAANGRKKAFAEEMAEKTAAFDRELDSETEAKLQKFGQKWKLKWIPSCQNKNPMQRRYWHGWKKIMKTITQNMSYSCFSP